MGERLAIKDFETEHARNFVRLHMASEGKTPSEMCGFKVEGENKWVTLIQNATRNKTT